MLVLMLSTMMAVAPANTPPVISPAQAVNHVGEEVIVRGQITQIVLSVNLTTHINFGGVYPNHVFTATIFKANQKLFPRIRDLDGKPVHVQGVVHLYRGKPEIVLTRPTQIRAAE
jgi:DNA/RNA endonuclease YhcR with UshA esterase domain